MALSKITPESIDLDVDSDGTIIEFQKNNSTVGSIGSVSGDTYIGTGDVGLRFDDGNNILRPVNSSGTDVDGNINLGGPSQRFLSAYLSGGVYLGGTGAANQLDDYEEGAWSPNISDDTGVVSTQTNQGKYVKIGNLVWVSARIFGGSAFTTTGTPYISLPFAAGGGQNQSVSGVVYSVGAGGATGLFLIDGATELLFTNDTDNPFSNVLGNGTTMNSSSKRLYFGPIVYSID